MAEYQEYTKVVRLSRVEINQMYDRANIIRDAYENNRGKDFIVDKLIPWGKAVGTASSLATIFKAPIPYQMKFVLAVVSLANNFIGGTNYYLNMLKTGEHELLRVKQFAEANKSKYKYFEFEVAIMEYMTTTAEGRVPVVYIQGSDIVRRAQKHDGTWVNV
ncbi:hypothetical protein L2089_15430 [Paenibacillus hunanensis]|uniref:hypothetical protein n=1 Tax=Paenibacillus hunanensis TaxID=539262 RepID=UPI0020275541|nr:hypothetical protein [Paenibacillus hunanensis]MCL9662085.1 hypothetical protein [Paenibacillus hunanensis]